jgi:hypothetical protein
MRLPRGGAGGLRLARAGLAAALMFAVFLAPRILARRREPRPFTRQ